MNDERIIDLYFARSESAIAATSAKYGRLIKSIAYNILKNTSDSEECESDTYLAAWNSIPPSKPDCLSAFLGRIARNIALDKWEYYRADKRNCDFEVTLSELEEILSNGTNPENHLEAAVTAEHISTFLRGKSYTKRVIFTRRYWYCDSVKEISEKYGFSESKVKSMLMRLRNELKKYLEECNIL